ncbi:TetR/AcrR family transcriptional regulator [Paenibacillus harenae]|uniref:TetR/AcrR family transcriptional regulator n=1 Tax=Paenibacillus harenae TaxID=306543 RepID=UPI0027931599|nr:TetR/AcrR family transcriptional regulator [Paenibacillus harenae]MDQ0061928.1 AcrR family transcriptional regulator [Paenibacillus harenae]
MADNITTPEKIKLAALTHFTESGYEGASMSQIAKEVGIKTPSIYAHFKSKEQLFLQLMQQVIDEEWEHYIKLLQEIREEPAQRKLYRIFGFFTDFAHLTSGQAFLKRTMVVPPRHLREQLRISFLQYEERISEHIIDIIREGQREGLIANRDEQRIVAELYAFIDGLLVEYQFYNSALFEQRKRLLWESLWRLWTSEIKEG